MIADTSFLVGLFNPNDPWHERALKDFRASDAYIIAADRIVEETMSVFSYRFGWKDALEILDKIRANRRFVVRHLSASEIESIVEFSREAGKKISFQDYVVAYLSRKEGSVPLCYDEQIIRLAKK